MSCYDADDDDLDIDVDSQPLRCEADHPDRGVCEMPLRSPTDKQLYEGDDDSGAVCLYAARHSSLNPI